MELNVKQQLHQLCVSKADERILAAREAMLQAQESANAEEKSSAGDKYETGRAMAQRSRDQAAVQLEEALKLKAVLDKINPANSLSAVGLGSLVITDKSRFYLAVSLGKFEVDGHEYFVISQLTPIGKLLFNSVIGHGFTFNNQVHTIIDVL
jgi:hypothetical protein